MKSLEFPSRTYCVWCNRIKSWRQACLVARCHMHVLVVTEMFLIAEEWIFSSTVCWRILEKNYKRLWIVFDRNPASHVSSWLGCMTLLCVMHCIVCVDAGRTETVAVWFYTWCSVAALTWHGIRNWVADVAISCLVLVASEIMWEMLCWNLAFVAVWNLQKVQDRLYGCMKSSVITLWMCIGLNVGGRWTKDMFVLSDVAAAITFWGLGVAQQGFRVAQRGCTGTLWCCCVTVWGSSSDGCSRYTELNWTTILNLWNEAVWWLN